MAKLAYKNLAYGLSYSRMQDLDMCPRYYQIANIIGYSGDTAQESVDFAYGHAVAEGIQYLILNPTDLNTAIFRAFVAWNIPFYLENSKTKKSVWMALEVVRRFHKMLSAEYSNVFKNFELAYFEKDGKLLPAIELTFSVQLPKGYIYEGHIDLVLKEKGTNSYVVLELKTTSFTNLSPAMYQNSIQALGYAIVLDQIAQETKQVSSYSVFYWVCKSSKFEFESFVFPKSFQERINFLNQLLVKIEVLELYKELDFYPSHGQSCFNFFRECKYLSSCKMSDETLKKLATNPNAEHSFAQAEEPDFVFTFEQIRETQLELMKRQVIPTVAAKA